MNPLFRKRLLAPALFAAAFIAAGPCFAQASPEALLQRGMRQYREARFELAVLTLRIARENGLGSREDRINASRTLAYCHAALGDTAAAKQELLRLLEQYPVYDVLFSDSPKMKLPLKTVLESGGRPEIYPNPPLPRKTKPGLATLFIQSEPWAMVYLDGVRIDWTPLTVYDVHPGNHELAFEPQRPGFSERIRKTVRVETGDSLRICETLQ
jgi:hypothetical protein